MGGRIQVVLYNFALLSTWCRFNCPCYDLRPKGLATHIWEVQARRLEYPKDVGIVLASDDATSMC